MRLPSIHLADSKYVARGQAVPRPPTGGANDDVVDDDDARAIAVAGPVRVPQPAQPVRSAPALRVDCDDCADAVVVAAVAAKYSGAVGVRSSLHGFVLAHHGGRQSPRANWTRSAVASVAVRENDAAKGGELHPLSNDGSAA